MAKINLRDFYPFSEDYMIEVPDDVVAELYQSEREEQSYIRHLRRYGAYYALDVAHCTFLLVPSSAEMYEYKLEVKRLYIALNTLPPKQKQRIYAHFILGMTKCQIAQAEGVDESAVRRSIERGLCRVRKILQKKI